MQKIILKIDGIFLMLMGTLAGITDLVAYYTGKGPFGSAYYQNDITIGGFEAHCLAVITGYVLFSKSKADKVNFYTKIGLITHLVLGTANLLWFGVFFNTGTVAMGYITTIAHFTFAFLHIMAIYQKQTNSIGFR
ncbi:MAG TPA: hypothetical protein VF476_01335 [Chitinophagaceae bacterium]